MQTASEFLLDDAVYENVKDGWNVKLNSSSQKLSGLTPFIELYAVFATNDTIFKNPMMFSVIANWMRLNPEKRKIMDDWYQETGGNTEWSAGFMDRMIQDTINDMAKTNFSMRQLTNHEKYMLAVAKQRRQQALQEQAKILPFKRRD